MQKIKEIKEGRPLPSGNWRKLYQCKVKKGDHEFKLVIPKYGYSFLERVKNLSVEEYYQQERARKEDRTWFFSKVLYHYECVHCHKSEMTFGEEKVPNKKIRKIVQ